MGTHVIERDAGLRARLPAAVKQHAAWLAGGLVLGFTVPFVFADTLELPRDLYYGVYVLSVAAFFVAWAASTGQSLGEMARRRLLWTILLGLAATGVLVLVVLGTQEATARPEGLELIGAVIWRGIVYGAADGLLLSAFPILAVFAMFAGTRARQRLGGKIAIGVAAFAASLVMTGVYHVGYSDFRSEKVRQPIAGDLIWSAPTLLTLNPIGAPMAHAGFHVTAVLHSYETDLMLPPHE